MNRVLVLMDDEVERGRVAALLGADCTVIAARADDAPAEDFDLCVVDATARTRLRERIRAWRAAAQPTFLPVLLVASREAAAGVEAQELPDELLVPPVDGLELRLRAGGLLRARRLSLADAARERVVSELRTQGALLGEQARAEKALSDTIVDSFPAIFYVIDEAGRFLRWNRNFEQVSGYAASEIASMHPLDFFDGRDEELIAERIGLVFAKGSADAEASFITKGGARIPHYFTGVRTKLNGVTCLIGVGIDVTERRRAEKTLRDLSAAVNASGDVVFMTDRDGIITSINARFTELYGHPQERVVGVVTPRILKSGELGAEAYRTFWESVLEGRLFRGELVNRTADGRAVFIEETVSPYLDDRGEIAGFLAIQRDITERKRLEEEHEKLQERVLASQRMEAVGRLAGGVAHDFNNLLAVILSYADFALEGLREADPLRADLEEIRRAGERAADLTKQLLAFSRRQVLVPRVLDLNRVVAGMEGMLRRILGARIEVRVGLAAGLGPVLADPGQLEQVVMNLAVNARDAMPSGGVLTITTASAELEEGDAEDGPGGAGDGAFVRYVVLSVSDTGSGMDAATREHVFEPFFTTKEQGKGTGLGLATVYGIVKQSGGTIRLYSEPGRGTTFRVCLPQVDAPASEAPREGPTGGATGSETVLVVEDALAVRRIVERMLRAAGYHVLVAGSGAEALALCEGLDRPIDLLLTDVEMPQMSGRALAERLVSRRPGLKVVYMSGHTDDAIVRSEVHDPRMRFLAKPFSSAELTRAIRDALDLE